MNPLTGDIQPDKPQYFVLKKPVSIEPYDGGELLLVDDYILLQSEIANLFQPFNRETLTQQIENLLQDHGARFYADHEIDRIAYGEHKTSEDVQGEQENEARREFASTVVGLLYPEKSEQ